MQCDCKQYNCKQCNCKLTYFHYGQCAMLGVPDVYIKNSNNEFLKLDTIYGFDVVSDFEEDLHYITISTSIFDTKVMNSLWNKSFLDDVFVIAEGLFRRIDTEEDNKGYVLIRGARLSDVRVVFSSSATASIEINYTSRITQNGCQSLELMVDNKVEG